MITGLFPYAAQNPYNSMEDKPVARFGPRHVPAQPPEDAFSALVNRAHQTLISGSLALVSRTITDLLNHTHVHNHQTFLDVTAGIHGQHGAGGRVANAFGVPEGAPSSVESGPWPKRGLITVSNHVTAVDDPGAVAPLVPLQWLLQPHRLRWTLCAADRCFGNPLVSAILRGGRALPIERGKGPDQLAMDAVVAKLDSGEWLHMFPEGTRQPYGQLGRMRPGVGRLVADARLPPIVLPFYHRGLHTLLKKGEVLPIGFGNRIDILVGQPLDFTPLLAELRAAGVPERDVHVAVAARIGEALAQLKGQLEQQLGPEVPITAPPPR